MIELPPVVARVVARTVRVPQPAGLAEPCAIYTGAIQSAGYGNIRVGPTRNALTHRLMYEFLVGPIPDAMVLDHLCKVRPCWHPGHTEPVSIGENTHRGKWAAVWRDYRAERQRQEDALDAACIGYATERADLLARGWRLVTFTDWLYSHPFERYMEA